MGAAHTTATAPRQPMAALARGLGAACRISVARLRPAESDVRSMSSTRSKTVGAVRQVRGGAEAGFWVVCWVPRGSARQLEWKTKNSESQQLWQFWIMCGVWYLAIGAGALRSCVIPNKRTNA